jgi:hypothetical protein
MAPRGRPAAASFSNTLSPSSPQPQPPTTRIQQWRRQPLKQRLFWALGTLLGLSIYTSLLVGVSVEDRSYLAIKETNHWNKIELLEAQKRRARSKSSLRGGSHVGPQARYQYFDIIVPETDGYDDDDDDEDQNNSGSTEHSQEEASTEAMIQKHKRRKANRNNSLSPFWSMFLMFCLLSSLQRRIRRPRSSNTSENALLVQLLSRINQQRRIRGEGPLSMDTLRRWIHDENFSSNDYERLWQMQEEEQTATTTILNNSNRDDEDSNNNASTTNANGTQQNANYAAVLSRIPEGTYAENSVANAECSICLETFSPAEHVRIIPQCRHCFHSQCIQRWLQESTSCPICKRELPND